MVFAVLMYADSVEVRTLDDDLEVVDECLLADVDSVVD